MRKNIKRVLKRDIVEHLLIPIQEARIRAIDEFYGRLEFYINRMMAKHEETEPKDNLQKIAKQVRISTDRSVLGVARSVKKKMLLKNY